MSVVGFIRLLSASAIFAICLGATSDFSVPPENKIRVGVNWLGPRVKLEAEEYDNVMFMTSVDKERYRCVLPSVSDEKREEEAMKDYKGQSPFNLLRTVFSRILCAIKIDSFWVYELCHGYYVRQFHEEVTAQGNTQQEFILGKFELSHAIIADHEKVYSPEDKYPTVEVDGVQLPYFAINMTDGTFCDLSGKNRFTRVMYVCHIKGNNAIYTIRELSSCEYEIVVLTATLCLHPAFQIKHFTETSISCHSMDGAPMMPKKLRDFWEDAMKPEHFDPYRGTSVLDGKKLEEEEKVEEEKPTMADHDQRMMENILKGEHCLRGGTSWWRYEFCYGKYVQQYHLVPGYSRETILLGVWDPQKHIKWLEDHPSKKPKKGDLPTEISHFYSDGQFCDEVNKPRQVEVKLRCKQVSGHLDAITIYLVEAKTCEYTLSVESSFFCHLLQEVDENGLSPELS